MEINEINNRQLKIEILNYSVGFLVENNIIKEEDAPYTEGSFGYMYKKDNGEIEALYKINCKNISYYFALQNNSIKYLEFNEESYQSVISKMTELHECLRDNSISETEVQQNRRKRNNKYLSDNNITFAENLPCIYEDTAVKLKDLDDVCRKAIASLIIIQISCDIRNGKYEESLDYFMPMLKKFGVEDCLNSKEKRIIEGTYTRQDVIDMDWAYETYWAICWYLGLIDDIKDASRLCDCNEAISFVMTSKSIEDFKSKCSPRSLSEILDMEDLYYRYNWAINNKKIDPNTKIGNLNASNVIERRRGLEWIISNVDDWFEVDLIA